MDQTVASETVRAAGCVVWRRTKKGNVKVLLIHRPRYDDWSFPKGKCDAGESFPICALRELKEEVNVSGTLGPELPPTLYRDGRGRSKIVRYWAVEYCGAEFLPNEEVDEVRWVKPQKAALLLTYDRDVGLLSDFLKVVE